jgi:hypothetical protein
MYIEPVKKSKSDSFTENVIDDDFRLLTADARQAGERALVRKLDSRLMPTAVFIYLLNYIDVRKHPFVNLIVLTCTMHSVSLLLLRGCKA